MVAGLALVAAVTPSVATAQAVGETCLGQPATIVGTGYVDGTPGDDVIVVEIDHSGGVAAGAGDDLICVSGYLSRGTDEPPVLAGGDGTDTLQVRGSKHNDQIDVATVEKIDIKLGRGFDWIRMDNVVGSGRLDGGPGGDAIDFRDYFSVHVDLEDQQARLNISSGNFTLKSFRNVGAKALTVDLTGDGKGNKLDAYSCRAKVRGGGGNDWLQARLWESDDPLCDPKGAVIYGLKGNDRMFGSELGDSFRGGPGRDIAFGGKGKDRCIDVEKKQQCEL